MKSRRKSDDEGLLAPARDPEVMAKLFPGAAAAAVEGISFEPDGMRKLFKDAKSYLDGDGPVIGVRLDKPKGISLTVKWRF